ncbi:MAG: outer membrane lipid asymmetry maintenance protein MlaD [Candidatus Tectomicrobia bacterium]|uniref:Outer membrane lipid asymmetry maintenance protein MlaD n=1 Tax=Tectimicrobiota bacterium TaxID=2528274 RepID=A0A932G040_UNCTE|nr:outer membrane lipid asymmetry maintenance protein MlaD [Candidatus Tectomicrobia bacterium]
MKRLDLEIIVGLFMLVGIAGLAYLSVKLGKLELFGKEKYDVVAQFSNIGGLNEGARVEIAGVQVGRVKNIGLANYHAQVILAINDGVRLADDSIAAIKTKGLLGEKFIEISPGGSERIIPAGGKIRETQPPLDLEEALSKFIFGKV